VIDRRRAADDCASLDVACHAALWGYDRSVTDLAMSDYADLSRENHVVADLS
jgi:hypothetical protein